MKKIHFKTYRFGRDDSKCGKTKGADVLSDKIKEVNCKACLREIEELRFTLGKQVF